MQLRFRPAALKDLEDIYDFIADDNLARAGQFIDLIEEKCSDLAKNPLIGRLRPELKKDLRSFPVQRYLIFYWVKKNTVEVVHVLHGARDFEALF